MDRKASEEERLLAKSIANAALDNRTTILEAVRKLASLAHTDAVPDEADRRLIIAIESETDHLPVGEVRALWNEGALREKDPEIARAEARWETKFLDACRRISKGNSP